MLPRNAIASWMRPVPSWRAADAGMAVLKKIQTWAPRPDWDTSNAAGIPRKRAALTYANASSIAAPPSKSAATHQQVSCSVKG